MGLAAVPAYLGNDFSTAAPGHRFDLYLPLWVRGTWTREPDKQAGKDGSPATGKTPTFKSVVALGDYFKNLNRLICERQTGLAESLSAQGRLLTLHAQAVAPFTTGLGNEHPLENGFAFLNPYGLPYLPGSGVKGVLRRAARELAQGEWGDAQGWTDDAINALFGKTGGDGEAELQRGALMFWDVIPRIECDSLKVEVMTPHQTHYYRNGETPHESGLPNPINFLTVPPGAKFVFHVQCDLPFLRRLAAELAAGDRWQILLTAALKHAFEWLGFGAKTAVGYGAMSEDEVARQLAEKHAAAQRERNAALERERRRAEQSPEQREADDAAAAMAAFRALLAAERKINKYKAGQNFDQQRAAFMQLALKMNNETSRRDAAHALRDSYEFTGWPSKKERKQEVKQWLARLDGQS